MRFCRGYTMIELLVVITLIGLMTGGSIAGYLRFNARQTVLSNGKQLMVMLRTAQSKAISGVKPATTCTTLLGYGVTALAGSSRYSLFASCSDGVPTISTVTMPSDVTIQSNLALTFNGQYGGVSGTTGDIILSGNGVTYTLNVNPTGDITEKGLR